MSAQRIAYEPQPVSRPVSPSLFLVESREDGSAPYMPYELIYHVLSGPEPTAEELAREYFLLECD